MHAIPGCGAPSPHTLSRLGELYRSFASRKEKWDRPAGLVAGGPVSLPGPSRVCLLAGTSSAASLPTWALRVSHLLRCSSEIPEQGPVISSGQRRCGPSSSFLSLLIANAKSGEDHVMARRWLASLPLTFTFPQRQPGWGFRRVGSGVCLFKSYSLGT